MKTSCQGDKDLFLSSRTNYRSVPSQKLFLSLSLSTRWQISTTPRGSRLTIFSSRETTDHCFTSPSSSFFSGPSLYLPDGERVTAGPLQVDGQLNRLGRSANFQPIQKEKNRRNIICILFCECAAIRCDAVYLTAMQPQWERERSLLWVRPRRGWADWWSGIPSGSCGIHR